MASEEERLEWLEKGLADRLENTVRKRVTASFVAMGVFAGGVLSFFGYNVVENLKTSAAQAGNELVVEVKSQVDDEIGRLTAQARSEVDAFIADAEDRISQSVSRSQEATHQASSSAASMLMQLRIIDEYLKRREDNLVQAETEARKRNAKLLGMQAEVEDMQTEVGNRVTEIRTSLSAVRNDIGNAQQELLAEIAAQQEAIRNRNSDQAAASREGLDALATGLEGLATQVERMGAQLDALQQEVSAQPVRASVDHTEITQVVDFAQSQKFTALDEELVMTVPPSVYIQFAGVSRDRIERVSEALRDAGGYDIPGEERLSAAAGKHEVRFFWENNRDDAKTLMLNTNEVLERLGYRGEVTVTDLTTFPDSRKPNGNTLELWLEPVPVK